MKNGSKNIFGDFILDYNLFLCGYDSQHLFAGRKEANIVVLCDPNKKKEQRLDFNGINNCALIAKMYGSLTQDEHDCIGFGDCANACPNRAIVIQNGTAVVTNECCGCETCVAACPKGLIAMVPKSQKSIQYKNDGENEHIIEIPVKKDFKFWRNWYRILK